MTRAKRTWAAYHEAGHAVRAIAWQIPVNQVSINLHPAGDKALGTERLKPVLEECRLSDLLVHICICSAGESAEFRFRRGGRPEMTPEEVDDLADASRFDRQSVKDAMKWWIPVAKHDLVTEWIVREVDDWFERLEVWRVVEAVARALARHGTLTDLQLGAAPRPPGRRPAGTPASPRSVSGTTNPPQSA